MTDQTPSGNRWEPTGAPEPFQPPEPTETPEPPPAAGNETAPLASAGAIPPPPSYPPPPPATSLDGSGPAPSRGERLRAALRRPGRTGWIAAAVAALVVLTGAGGVAAGRATVDDHGLPARVDQQWHQPGPGQRFGDGDRGQRFDPDRDGGELPAPQS